MPTIAHTVAALAKKLNPEAADCLSGNIKTNLDAITAAKNGELSDLSTISAAVEMLTEVVGNEEMPETPVTPENPNL